MHNIPEKSSSKYDAEATATNATSATTFIIFAEKWFPKQRGFLNAKRTPGTDEVANRRRCLARRLKTEFRILFQAKAAAAAAEALIFFLFCS